MRIGVLGVGSLAEYLIRGAQGSGYSFLVSPRSADRAERLAAAYGCVVADSNQAVVDACNLVLVCLPAGDGLAILQGLSFRAEQSVCSAMAGANIGALRTAVAPADGFCSMMPGYANAFSAGPCLLYPPDPAWAAFLGELGPVHEFDSAEPFETAAVFGAMSGASIFLMRHLARWYEAQGLPADSARQLVAETFRGNAEVLLQADAGLDQIAKGVTTPGGITEALVATLNERGALAAWDEAMDKVLKRMSPDRG
jgi:pyrroline-5-carboxylate reductase